MKLELFRLADTSPDSIHEVFTMGELINRVAKLWHPWEVYRFETMAVVHFLN